MTPQQAPESQKDVTECQLCKRPLGQETRDMRIVLCHDCRKCSKCGLNDTQRSEIQYCLTNNLAITHARCLSTQTVKLDANVELMNLGRLLMFPNVELSRDTLQQQIMTKYAGLVPFMSHEQILLHIKQAEAIIAAGSLALAKNRKEIEVEITEKEKTKFKQAQAEAKKAQATVSDKKAMTAEEKSIATFMGLGMTRQQAEQMTNAAKAARREKL